MESESSLRATTLYDARFHGLVVIGQSGSTRFSSAAANTAHWSHCASSRTGGGAAAAGQCKTGPGRSAGRLRSDLHYFELDHWLPNY